MLNKVLYTTGFLLKKSPIFYNALLNYKSNSLRIIYYHVISKNKLSFYPDSKSISIDEFKHQLIFFKKFYDIISLTDALNLVKNGDSLKRKLVITFDDGFTDNYSSAAPILVDLKCEATFFLLGNCIDNKDLMWKNKLQVMNRVDEKILIKGLEIISKEYNLKYLGYRDLTSWNSMNKWCTNHFSMTNKEEIVNRLWNCTMNISIEEYLDQNKPYMNTSQIQELNRQGFEFGAHSMSHPDFSKLSYREFKNEIVTSKVKIEHIINKRVNSFAYPFGIRASFKYEKQLLKENPGLVDTFLGTRNRLNNTDKNSILWERDNLEFPFEIALSRFFLVSVFRSFSN